MLQHRGSALPASGLCLQAPARLWACAESSQLGYSVRTIPTWADWVQSTEKGTADTARMGPGFTEHTQHMDEAGADWLARC